MQLEEEVKKKHGGQEVKEGNERKEDDFIHQ